MTARVVIDAANLVAGGGIQVGASFIDELGEFRNSSEWRARHPWLEQVEVSASSAVIANLRFDGDRSWVTEELPPQPWSRPRRVGAVADVVFEVFGPVYRPLPARRRVTGFADVTSLVPEQAGAESGQARARLGVRRRLSRRCFARSNHLVVEAQSMGQLLTSRWNVPQENLSVVPNVLNSAFVDTNNGEPLIGLAGDVATFCYVTRAYAHKNLRVLGPAVAELKKTWGQEARLVLTLTSSEFAALDPVTRDASINLGPLTISEVPAVYRSCTGTIFTSLLESFSATPLEAVACGSILIASDRPFVRDVVGEAAWYVDPLSPQSIAQGMWSAIHDRGGTEARRTRGYQIAQAWPNARDRAASYVELVDDQLKISDHTEERRERGFRTLRARRNSGDQA